jgi:hypothetical protein
MNYFESPRDGVVSRFPDTTTHASTMAQETGGPRGTRYWIVLVGIVIALIFLYFYKPFENLVGDGVRGLQSSTIIFWFAALVGVAAYVVSHWQSFRRNLFHRTSDLDAEELVYDTLQIAILVAVILCAGGILQIIGMLGEHLINREAIVGPAFGRKLLAIVFLMIMAVGFFLLHRMVRAIRIGWRPGKAPPRSSTPSRRNGG